ncbi:MAG: bifunctional 4-hydroxy-2-oxoglutarate aldolase/2-dehydro-3-deoxy-phosphogluconate aldolase [Microcoleaceae cyanobacterium]
MSQDSNHIQHHSQITLQQLQRSAAIAVIRCETLDLGRKMAEAVAKGGMTAIEITWNSERPTELITQLRSDLPHCHIGAGTLLNLNHLHQAIASGAQFLFSPHTNVEMIQAANTAKIAMIAGALSPTEIVSAWQAGATAVKVFPISAVGGINYIKSLSVPLGQIPLIPTGGVTLNNAKDFINAGAVAVGLSGDLFLKSLMQQHNWLGITQRAVQLKQQLPTI